MASACKTPVVFDDPSGTLQGLLPSIRASLNRAPGPMAMWAVALGLSLRGIGRRVRLAQAATSQRSAA
jgi:hypothetical protein